MLFPPVVIFTQMSFKSDGTVEDQMIGSALLYICTKIAQALELVEACWFGRGQARFQLAADEYFHRVRIDKIVEGFAFDFFVRILLVK